MASVVVEMRGKDFTSLEPIALDGRGAFGEESTSPVIPSAQLGARRLFEGERVRSVYLPAHFFEWRGSQPLIPFERYHPRGLDCSSWPTLRMPCWE